MFAVDIETLSQKGDAVILSCALTHFNFNEKYTFEELVEKTCFVKFNIREQIELYNRRTSRETIGWWNNQSDEAKRISFIPSKNDCSIIQGIDILREYVNKNSIGKEIVFCRGSLDQFVLYDLFETLNKKQLFEYYQFRCFRTAIDCLKNTSERGFCHIPNFNMSKIVEHNPIHDNCRDIMMLLYGE